MLKPFKPYGKKEHDFIVTQCNSHDYELCTVEGMESCPCRVVKHEIVFCNLVKITIEYYEKRDFSGYERFLKLICAANRTELQGKDIKSIRITVNLQRAVSAFENGEFQIGDRVYCADVRDDVILLELPSEEVLRYYHENGVIAGGDLKFKWITVPDVRYTLNNKTYSLYEETYHASLATFYPISKGNFRKKYEIYGKSPDNMDRVYYLEHAARREGFRVKWFERKNSVVLRFYGDSQEQLDEFVQMVCRNKMVLY
jgi:hypothetical protein